MEVVIVGLSSNSHLFQLLTFSAWYDAGTTGPIPWTIFKAQNVLVENINMVQSPFWHNFIYQSSNVTFNNIHLNSIQSDGSQAQNTGAISSLPQNRMMKVELTLYLDGWDIYRSSNIAITNSHIINGDDCVSLKPNSTNVLVQNLYCQGSHGISMGSVGQYAGVQDIIADVLVKNITMVNASNGARIKAFGGSSSSTSTKGGGNGYIRNITFQDFRCNSVALPIVIDQCYETSASTCASYPSKVLINDIHYINVTGTGTKSKEVVTLVCSDICGNITATGTNLVGSSGRSQYFCTKIGSLTNLDFPCSIAGSTVSGRTTTKKSTTSKSSTSEKTTTATSSAVKTTRNRVETEWHKGSRLGSSLYRSFFYF